MFIRLKTTPRSSSISVQLVESFREHGKTRQRVLRHVGTTDDPEKLNALKQLAESLKAELSQEKLRQQKGNHTEGIFASSLKISCEETETISVKYLEEQKRLVLGIHDVYGYVYDKVGFSNPFTYPVRRAFSAKILRDIVLARIANPASKRASVEWLETEAGISLNLDHVYQMMDKIDDRFCDRIQQAALATTLKLTGQKLQIIFYDATTLYFESFSEDELKCNGYSKDMKFNQPQVLLTLFVTEKGLPVGYELFPGNTFEGHTLIPVLEKLKTRYQLEEVIVVADRGLLSEENLLALEEKKFKYIVGARIKNVSKKNQAIILDEKNYKPIDIQWNIHKKESEKPIQRLAVCSEKHDRQLIVHYHSGRAKKDAYDRNKTIEKLYKKLIKSKDPKALLNNYGYKKYIDVTGEAKLTVNEEKIQQAQQWDGLLGVITNITDRTPEALLKHYRGLWQIEESFRINKHDLKMRPIYHWTPSRIKAHIAIAFMAFVCVRYLEYRMKTQSEKCSPEEIRKALLHTQASLIQDKKTQQQYLLPSKLSYQAKELYRILRIPHPQRLLKIKHQA